MKNNMSNKVPPNGGWGWIIVLSYALNSLTTISIIYGFGLVFKDIFPALELSGIQCSAILNLNLAFGMLLGLVNGPLLRNFGYRKVALFGSLIYTSGVILTAFANSFLLLMISYGILTSAGMGLSMSGFSFALNSYFTTRRNRAMGLAITLMGIGPIIVPQLTTIMIKLYGIQGTILLFGAYSLHNIVASLLLHPLKWHMKELPIPVDDDNEKSMEILKNERSAEEEAVIQEAQMEMQEYRRTRKTTISSIDHDVEVGSIYGFENPLPRQLSETARMPSYEKNLGQNLGTSMINLPLNRMRRKSELRKWNSGKSVNLGSSVKIFEEDNLYEPLKNNISHSNIDKQTDYYQNNVEKGTLLYNENITTVTEKMEDHNDNVYEQKKQKSLTTRALRNIVVFYDLNLLRDPIYVNIMLGMSIAIFAEINFSTLMPFMLADWNLNTNEIATVMSIIATTDLIFRGIAPYIGEWLHQSSRMMYLWSLILLIISRMTLLLNSDFTSLIIIASGLGLAKGIRSVYMSLVIPGYVPIERLPYASGIQMVVNGIFLLCVGPLLGFLKDKVGSYIPTLVVINCLTTLTIVMWAVEMIVVRRIKLRSMEENKNRHIQKC